MNGHPAAEGAPYLCKPCVKNLYRQEKLDRISLHQLAGAPSGWIQETETKLLAGSPELPGLPPRIWGEILARGLDKAAEKEQARLQAEAAAVSPEVDGAPPP